MSSIAFTRAACAGFVVLFIGKTAPAFAQPADDTQALRNNCAIDYLKLCAGLDPKGQEVRGCFKRNRAKLSDGCSATINAYTVGKSRR